MNKCVYASVEVGGIQKYIASTGKLKDMIGGSEIINRLTEEKLYKDKICKGLGLKEAEPEEFHNKWIQGNDKTCYLVVQASAGILSILFPTCDTARNFLKAISTYVLENFPGLPFYGSMVDMDWTREGYKKARNDIHKTLGELRSRLLPPVMAMTPLSIASRIDGLPAVIHDKEYVSLPSLARRQPSILQDARDRLRDIGKQDGIIPIWEDDIEDLAGESRIALIHMDGNDLGKKFQGEFDKLQNVNLVENITHIKNLSQKIAQANKRAFEYAAQAIARHIYRKTGENEVSMPLRPLVMGGDDISLVIKAEYALVFINLFVKKFEEQLAQDRITLGVGMVVSYSGYPFNKGFRLAESLLDSAKKATVKLEPRPSSMDYLVITEEVESNVEAYRKRVFEADDGAGLTGKPLLLDGTRLNEFVKNGHSVLKMPRTLLRPAYATAHKGRKASQQDWQNIRTNIARGIGGRHGSLTDLDTFDHIFDKGFFKVRENADDTNDANWYTSLGDYLELERLLPESEDELNEILKMLDGNANV